MDRDTKFSEAFRVIMEQAGVEAVRLPPRSPNLSPNLERFMRSVKEECLERVNFFGERSLQNAVADFLVHYHQERNHQGLNNQLIQPGEEVGRTAGDVACRERLGGMLRHYYRLFRFRNKRYYSEFLTTPSEASTNRRWPRKMGLLMARIWPQLGIVPGLELHGF